jgi:hypothetical protein
LRKKKWRRAPRCQRRLPRQLPILCQRRSRLTWW